MIGSGELDRRQVDLAFAALAVLGLGYAVLQARLRLYLGALVTLRLVLVLERIERNLRTDG